MTLDQLRIFVAVAEREHVTLAARELNLTQSAVSAAVAALEARYATPLFDRVGRRIALTEAGRLFLLEARAVLARARAAEQVLVDLADLTRGSLSLAASQTVGHYWLPPKIAQFHLRHPGVAIKLVIDNSAGVARRLHDGEADLGLIEDEIDDAALSAKIVAADELALVVPPGHAWARRPGQQPADLSAGPWILREKGSGTRAMMERALIAQGVALESLNVALELPSIEAVCSAVAAGAGVTMASTLVVACAQKAGVLTRVVMAAPQRHFRVLRHKEFSLTRAQKSFLELIAFD